MADLARNFGFVSIACYGRHYDSIIISQEPRNEDAGVLLFAGRILHARGVDLYRRGVVGVFIDSLGKVLVAERSDVPGAWQFPQGGVEDGESWVAAVHREMQEELGLDHVEIVRAGNSLVRYDFPPGRKPFSSNFLGQEQQWFLMTTGAEPNLQAADGEFTAWKWVPVHEAVEAVVEWKRGAYRSGLSSLGLLKDGDTPCPE